MRERRQGCLEFLRLRRRRILKRCKVFPSRLLSLSWGLKGRTFWVLGSPSGVPPDWSPDWLDGPVSGVEEGDEFWKNWWGNLQGSVWFLTWLSTSLPDRRHITAFTFLTGSLGLLEEEGTCPLGFASGWLGKVPGSLEEDAHWENCSIIILIIFSILALIILFILLSILLSNLSISV